MNRLVDMHCHLDFLPNPAEFACAADARGLEFYCATVTPAGFAGARQKLAGCENVRVGVGLHPWWLHDGRCGPGDIEQTCAYIESSPYVGEVGLDFGKRCGASRELQLQAFRAIAAACACSGGKLLTVHAVKSAHAVLDALEASDALACCTVIFHWFSDSGDALKRAIDAGCFFSVNPRMLATRRGREYTRQIPGDRLLLETDLPPEEGGPFPLDAWEKALRGAYDEVVAIRGTEVALQMTATSLRLLDR